MFCNTMMGQTHIGADPFYLLQVEKKQFQGKLPNQSNTFRPIFFITDSIASSIRFRAENYFNNNNPNQENMDVRYFSKGYGNFHSIQLSLNSPYFSFIAEPYIRSGNFYKTNNVKRPGPFSVLNDITLTREQTSSTFRNLLAFIHYKGIGFGLHHGNRWWGPGLHTSLQMTNNTFPFPAQIIGTLQELRIGNIGIYGLYTFAQLDDYDDFRAKYFTSLSGQLTWYGPIILSLGFNRSYLSGGSKLSSGYEWKEKDARSVVFEGVFTSNLVKKEYTNIRGGDPWDQTLAGYLSITLPESNAKLFAEFGFNDNRMFFADLLSQPDHTLATIIGFRDYGIGNLKNWVYGFEWANLLLTYTIRHRGIDGTPAWYQRSIYNYSTYEGRRWAAHSGADSDDWYLFAGYLSKNFMFIPAINYERHGVVSYRPAEVKIELRLDMRYRYNDIWFGAYFERQYEAFLGFPDYFYVDELNNPVDASDGPLARTRLTNTFILSISKKINFNIYDLTE